MRPPPIGMSDVFRAVCAIAPEDPSRWGDIAAALGFETRITAAPALPEAAHAGDTPPALPRDVVTTTPSMPRQEGSLPVLEPVSTPSSSNALPPFLVDVEELPRESRHGGVAQAPPLQPLWPATTAPALLRAAVVMPQPGGEPDVGAIVDALAQRRALHRLPVRRSWGIAHDVVVLLDLGSGMDAFIEDTDPLLDAMRRVAGRHAVRVEGFLGRPLEALERAGCHRGTAVVVLTDLGLSPLATAEERDASRWWELADAVARARARLTVLAPWDRWPTELSGRLALVTWDRSTTVAQVLHAVRQHA